MKISNDLFWPSFFQLLQFAMGAVVRPNSGQNYQKQSKQVTANVYNGENVGKFDSNFLLVNEKDGSHINWYLRRKAQTFGQSAKERRKVNYYLWKLEKLAERQHNSIDITDKSHKKPVINLKPVKASPDVLSQPRKSTKEDKRRSQNSKSKSNYKRYLSSKKPERLNQIPETDINPEEHGKHYEGDIVLFQEQAEAIYDNAIHSKDRRHKRKFIGPNARRWPIGKPIEYSFDGSHSQREQRIIQVALEHWQNITCMNFVRRDDPPTGNRIVFTDVDGCASNVGRHPLGEPQFVSLASECMRLGVIAHEVAHALGFWHEQSRPDRDQFVSVVWGNIDRGSKGQFLKEQPDEVDSAGIPYDYGSIMHYRSKAFARYDDLFTINTNVKDYQRTIGQRDQLSFNDIRLMNQIYCQKACSTTLPCKRGGYTDTRKCDRCRCPDGFTGRLCDTVMSGYGAKCGGELHLGSSWTTVKSPNYPGQFKEGQECTWLLKAPKGKHVEFQFSGTFDVYCKARHSLCMDYVEIRNSTDFANTGMRYCCYGTPQGSIFSATEDMLLLFRSFYQSGKGFQGRARTIEASGSWSDWGPWTICTGSCGGCGTQTRTRSCTPGAICQGSNKEVRHCNMNPCGLCPVTRYVTAPCGGFLSLLRGVRCKAEKTIYEPCDNTCCSGFVLSNGVCTQL